MGLPKKREKKKKEVVYENFSSNFCITHLDEVGLFISCQKMHLILLNFGWLTILICLCLLQYHSQVRQEQLLKPQCPSVWGKQQVKVGWQAQPQRQHPRLQTQSHFQHQQQQIQSKGTSVVGYENGRCVRPLGIPQSAWPPLQVQPNQQQQQPQQHSNAGMRAVFLGGSGVKRECTGTGVFLPRRYGNPPDSKKKSGKSPLLKLIKSSFSLSFNIFKLTLLAFCLFPQLAQQFCFQQRWFRH